MTGKVLRATMGTEQTITGELVGVELELEALLLHPIWAADPHSRSRESRVVTVAVASILAVQVARDSHAYRDAGVFTGFMADATVICLISAWVGSVGGGFKVMNEWYSKPNKGLNQLVASLPLVSPSVLPPGSESVSIHWKVIVAGSVLYSFSVREGRGAGRIPRELLEIFICCDSRAIDGKRVRVATTPLPVERLPHRWRMLCE